MLSFFPRDVLDEICDLIVSVSEDVPTYSFVIKLITIGCLVMMIICVKYFPTVQDKKLL